MPGVVLLLLLLILLLLLFLPFSISVAVASGQLVYNLEEESEVGRIIGNLLVDSHLEQKLTGDSPRSFRFRFLSQPSVDFLAVDELSGNLLTTSRVDREVVCRNFPPGQQIIAIERYGLESKVETRDDLDDDDHACAVHMDVAVQSSDHIWVIRCTVRIKDVNDNSPTFQPADLLYELLESSQVGSGFVVPTARDLDHGRFGIAGYLIHVTNHGDDKFQLKTLMKMDGSTEVRLVLVKSLDKETKDSHFLKVIAFDGGNPPKNGTLEVTVVVVDCNDNAPMFEQPLYETRMTENSALETVVLRILAHDADSGLNGEIVYGFAASTKAMYGNQFQVNPRSGEVKVIGSVDHEISHVCHLIVTATDRGNPPLQSEVPVKLQVDDVNDNRPIIVINTLSQANTDVANVSENAKAGTFVAYVIGKDADSGSNGRFNCSLTGGEVVYDHHSEGGSEGARGSSSGIRAEYFRLKRMYNGEYHIVTSALIDRENLARDKNCRTLVNRKKEEEGEEEGENVCFELTIVCQDHGTPSLRSDKRLSVSVADVNDNAPIFTRNVYRFEVFENSPVGFPFASVLATDSDSGENGRISYSLVPSNKAGPGLEVSNGGSEGQEGSLASSMFFVDPTTGELSPAKTVDHESVKNVVLEVVASDNGNPKLSTVVTVHLKVLDVNDQAPVFTSSVFRFRVKENEPRNTEVGRVTAVDKDFPPLNKFQFQLSTSEATVEDLYGDRAENISRAVVVEAVGAVVVGGIRRRPRSGHQMNRDAPLLSFDIDPESGVIRTNRPLDREENAQHVLVVTATDIQDRKLHSTAAVLVLVDDVNDNPPRFVYPSTPTSTFIHSEPLLKGRTFVSLSARDADAFKNGEIRYHIGSVLELHADRSHRQEFGGMERVGKKANNRHGQAAAPLANKTKKNESLEFDQLCDDDRRVVPADERVPFLIDPVTGRLTANEDFYILTRSNGGETLQNRTFAIEIVARDCGQPRRLESRTTLNLVVVKRIGTDSNDHESSESRGNSIFFYGNIVLSEESLSWTLVLCVVTAFIVIVLLTAIALVGCRGEDKTSTDASVVNSRSHANSAATYTTDGFRTALLDKHRADKSSDEPKRIFEDRFGRWKFMFRICRRFRRSS